MVLVPGERRAVIEALRRLAEVERAKRRTWPVGGEVARLLRQRRISTHGGVAFRHLATERRLQALAARNRPKITR